MLLVALLASLLVRTEPAALERRALLFLERLAAGLAAILVFHGMFDALDALSGSAGVLLALLAAAVAPLIVAEVARMLRERTLAISRHGRTADLALVTSAMLMAVSDQGVNGKGAMGLWGPVVFTIPLLAAWYSYEHLDEIRRTYSQTIRALGAAPELGGMVRSGHAERVAALTVAMAHELGFSRSELEHLETASLLPHLGQVCIDEPEDGRPPDGAAIAHSGADILRSTALLAPAGDIIAAEALPFRADARARPGVMSGQILKIAERVRRAVGRTRRPRRSRARSAVLGARVPLRRAGAGRAGDRARLGEASSARRPSNPRTGVLSSLLRPGRCTRRGGVAGGSPRSTRR